MHGNVRFPGSWRGLLDGPRADRIPNATLTCRVSSCYMIWFPGSRRRLQSRHSPRCARRLVSLHTIRRSRAATRGAGPWPAMPSRSRAGDGVADLASRKRSSSRADARDQRAPKGPVPWIHDRIDAASLDQRRVRRRPCGLRDTSSDEAGPVVRHRPRVPEAQCRIRPWSECPVVS